MMQEMDVGENIKKLRLEAGLSLRDLSKKSGVSPSTLSQIENNKINPNLVTLKKISDSLNVSVISLLTISEELNISFIKESERMQVVRNTTKNGNVLEEFLVDSLNRKMEPAIITMPHGTDSIEHVSHEGEEMIFVLEGEIEVELLKVKNYRLSKGDTLYYPCTIPHIFKNISKGESKFLIVATPPSF